MFKKQCLKFGSTVLLFFAAVIAGGCATTMYTPTAEDTRDLSRVQAEQLLLDAIQSDKRCAKSVRLTSEKLSVTCKEAKTGAQARVYRYADTPLLTSLQKKGWSCVSKKPTPDGEYCIYFWHESNSPYGYPHARDFARAWYVLAHTSAVDPAQEAAFEHVAQSYRNAQVKPPLPEEAVKYKVQAELAVQQKRFDDAVDLYDQALRIAPWWPAGHYNRGLIFGELQDFEEGIRALQKYLKLELDAPNARAVQIKIYQWESLVPQSAK